MMCSISPVLLGTFRPSNPFLHLSSTVPTEKGTTKATVAAPVFKEIAVSVNRDFPKPIEVLPAPKVLILL